MSAYRECGEGWDLTIGSLLAKGGKYAVRMERSLDSRKRSGMPDSCHPFDVLDESLRIVGKIVAEEKDWIGERRIKLVSVKKVMQIAKDRKRSATIEAITEQNFKAAQSTIGDNDGLPIIFKGKGIGAASDRARINTEPKQQSI